MCALSVFAVAIAATGLAACKISLGTGGSSVDSKDSSSSGVENPSGLEFTLRADGESYAVSGVGTSTALVLEIPEEYNALPVTSIGESAFENVYELCEVIIPESVERIGKRAFAGCSNLEEVSIGDGVVEIFSGAFSRCNMLIDVSFGSALEYIGDEVFLECGKLQSVEFNASLEGIDTKAFYNCAVLSEVRFNTGLKRIGESAFENCKKLKEIVIPDAAECAIEKRAFYYCELVSTIYIGHGVQTIGMEAFDYCRSAYKIFIGDGVTTIGVKAFQTCRKAVMLTLGQSVSSIDTGAFACCYVLVDVYNRSSLVLNKDKNNGWVGYYALNVYNEPNGSKVRIDENGYILYEDESSVKLMGNTTMTNFDLVAPDGVTEVHRLAFYNNMNVVSVKLPASCKKVGEQAFHFAYKLRSVDLGGVETVEKNAFADNTVLRSVSTGNSLKTLGENAFEKCKNLNKITFKGSFAEWNEISVATGNDFWTNAENVEYVTE